MYRNLIQRLVDKYGIYNLRFDVPMNPIMSTPIAGIGIRSMDSDTEFPVLCMIDETRYNRSVEDGYKVYLRAEDVNYGGEDYYQDDLSSILKSRSMAVYYLDDNGDLNPINVDDI